MSSGSFGVRDCIGTPFGLKDVNTNLDMLAALAELSSAGRESKVTDMLSEQFDLVHDRLVVEPGVVHSIYMPNWTPVPDLHRYGYSLTAANILAAASTELPPPRDGATALIKVKSLIDHLLRYAWDSERGGFLYGGSAFGVHYIEDFRVGFDKKYSWVQAEGMRALLRLAINFPEDKFAYFSKLLQLGGYIDSCLIDRENGGWFTFGMDYPGSALQPKASCWNDLSHQALSLLQCIDLLDAYETT
jgi:cellobiose epimerase